MASYATPAQMKERFDVRILGDLVTDTDTRVSAANLLTDTNLQAALDDASGEIEAALLQGKRYTTADLEGLSGNSAKYLARLTCEIAFGLLWERRPWYERDGREAAIERSKKALDLLRKGEHVFDVDGVKEAGVPSVEGPSRVELKNQNLLRTRLEGRYFPARSLPQGR